MKSAKKGALVLSILFLLSFQLVSAELSFDQTESLYNAGDKFEITLTVSSQNYASDFVTATLVCDDDEIEFYKSPLSIASGEEKEILISTNLDNFFVERVEGDCYVKATYGSERKKSQKFEITRDISINLNVGGILFSPGEVVTISGQATKANGELLDGFVQVSIPELDFDSTSSVKSGDFNSSLVLPNDAAPGSHTIKIKVYENDASGNQINEGRATTSIKIRQVIREISVALSAQSILPTEELTYQIILRDQAGGGVSADSSVQIIKPDGEIYNEKVVKSGETMVVALERTALPGYWKIKATSEDLETEKQFLVEDLKDISFELINETLLVKNTGNVPYIGPVDIAIGEVNDVKELSLQVGDSKQFTLRAPNGEYSIGIGDGSEMREIGSTFLTGNAISVDDADGGIFGNRFTILIILIVILILAIVAVYIYRKFIRKKDSQIPEATTPQNTSIPKKVDKSGMITSGSKSSTQVPTNMIDKGERQDSSIISLKIKNYEEIMDNKHVMSIVDSALWKAKEAGAKIYSDGEFRIMIFAPVLTKEKDNTLRAIRVARSMERIIHSFNRRTPTKIDFGIGVSHGTLIAEADQGKFKFISLNNLIANTKRISDKSDAETLIPESLRRTLAGKIKTEKLQNANLWKIERVIDRTEHKEYIHNLAKKTAHNPKRSR